MCLFAWCQVPLACGGPEFQVPLPCGGTELQAPLPCGGTEHLVPLPRVGGDLQVPLPRVGGALQVPLPRVAGDFQVPLQRVGGDLQVPLPCGEGVDGFKEHVHQDQDHQSPLLNSLTNELAAVMADPGKEATSRLINQLEEEEEEMEEKEDSSQPIALVKTTIEHTGSIMKSRVQNMIVGEMKFILLSIYICIYIFIYQPGSPFIYL